MMTDQAELGRDPHRQPYFRIYSTASAAEFDIRRLTLRSQFRRTTLRAVLILVLFDPRLLPPGVPP